MTPLDDVLSRLSAVKKTGKQFTARCPAHHDKSPSLSIKEGDDGRVLLYCHAGCTIDEVVRALGLTQADLFPTVDCPNRRSRKGGRGRWSGTLKSVHLDCKVSRPMKESDHAAEALPPRRDHRQAA